MYIEGKNAVISAIKNQKTINKILVDKNFSSRKDEIISIARQNKIKIEFLPRNILDKKSQTSHHQGYIAESVDFEYSSIDDILNKAKSRNEAPFIVILDCLQDPHNFGAIIRSCECAGVHGIIIQKDISHLLNLKEDFSICYYGEHIKIMYKIIHNVDKNTISELEKEGFNLQANEIQAGIYLINDTLYCYKELKNWLYNFCIKYKLNDEDAISIALNYFNIKVNKLDQRYNCIPSSDCNKDAFILHSIGSNKFWRGLYNKNWWDNHYQWVECGGSESFNDIEKKRKLIFKIMWFIPSTKLRNKLRAILLRYIGLSGR